MSCCPPLKARNQHLLEILNREDKGRRHKPVDTRHVVIHYNMGIRSPDSVIDTSVRLLPLIWPLLFQATQDLEGWPTYQLTYCAGLYLLAVPKCLIKPVLLETKQSRPNTDIPGVWQSSWLSDSHCQEEAMTAWWRSLCSSMDLDISL